MITLDHRSASSTRRSGVWEYDPARRVIEAVVRMGSAEDVAVVIQVSSQLRPIEYTYPLIHVGGDTWQLAPGYLEHDWRWFDTADERRIKLHDGPFILKPFSHDDRLPVDHITLTRAPPNVSDELRALDHPPEARPPRP